MQPLIVAEHVRQGVADYLATSFPGTTPGFEHSMRDFLAAPENVARGPYVTIALPFRTLPNAAAPFSWFAGFKPYAHQARAFSRLTGAELRSTLIATGTGSGKTEAFLFPVLEHCRRARAAGERGIKAILVYPMNALATDQANRVAKEIMTRPELSGITAGLYVGDDGESGERSTSVRQLEGERYTVITDRARLREEPPDILLTNYKMLDFLLLRAADAPLWKHNRPDTLRYLVVDELHSFDGAQGSDLACLIRRLKARLDMPQGALACVGTSATLGDEGIERLLAFARDVFAEPFDADAVIAEDCESVAEYLADATVEHVRMPAAGDDAALSPLTHASAEEYLAEQVRLWFGQDATAAQLREPAFLVELGRQLKQHAAFQNLLRDLHRLGGRAVALADLVDTVRRRLRDADRAPPGHVERWLLSLVALVAAAASAVNLKGERVPFLRVRVELWLRELRRMVASVAALPQLVHSDDLSADNVTVHLPPIHCRDCHAMGWGATQTRTGGEKLVSDLGDFYAAFFSGDTSVRFLFPTTESAPCNTRKFQRQRLCTACATLNPTGIAECAHCGNADLVLVDVTANQAAGRRHGTGFTRSTNHCPFCEGDRTLTIVGAQAASLASVALGQLFGSRYNTDKKLIAFSDSVQDAAHRAGFFEARNWRFNLRPALAQVIRDAGEAGDGLTLATLPEAFARRWREARGPREYVKTFMPPVLAWMRDYEHLLDDEQTLPTPYLIKSVELGLAWATLGEFGQDAHVGRTLPRTHIASVAFDGGALDAAVAAALPRLRERVDALRGLQAEALRVFLLGLLARLLRIGAIWHPGLRHYARGGCNVFVLKSNPAEFALLQTPRRPRYLSLQEHGKCDAVTGDAANIYRDWAYRALPELNRETFERSIVADVYREALRALLEAGLVEALDSEQEGVQVWGLRPEACVLSRDVAEWRCDTCRHTSISAGQVDLGGTCCHQLECRGRYAPVPAPDVQFYRQLYLRSDPWRIVAREHTGLLSRGARERIENEFKAGRVNVLSATPTLEMGIDIGDLSATLLCSAPPAQANYLQRVGRAGRATGNAFAATFVAGRPHDLYFWAEPREMLAGAVDAPGVFLNASAVLERQLTAFSLDGWVRLAGADAKIPPRLGDAIAAVRSKDGKQRQSRFPYPWLAHVEKNRATILAHFVAMFSGEGTQLSPESQAHLETFIQGGATDKGSLAWRLVNRLNEIHNDIADLKQRRERVDKEVARIEALAARGESDEKELSELRTERSALTRLMAGIAERDTLGFLTDEGLLPNYAFPEQGVLLRSVIVRDQRAAQDGEDRTVTYEYERPGASAITEFAPNSVFYAEGRHVTIEQVDVSRDKPTRWRFCRACSYAEEQAGQTLQESCPRCADTLWPDGGRVQTMLRLSKVYARTLESRSRIGDDSDDRQTRFFVKQMLVDVTPEAIRQAWKLDDADFPFAFEFADDIRLREVNFGERDGSGQPLTIAGDDQPKPGFALCPECGTVQRQRTEQDAWRNHALYCGKRKDAQSRTVAHLFLFREFASEGIRLYLPESAFADSEGAVQSFIAALRMGLERRFRGAVDHLRVAQDVRIAAGQETPRQYLVIYDSVPGGTGYLKELMRDATPLFEVFSLAAEQLASCACNSDEGKDGCYRCLYGYHNSYARKHVSRRKASQLLARILEHRDKLTATSSVDDVASNALFESTLERDFIEALRRRYADGLPRFDVREELVRGKPGYFLLAGDKAWSIEPQVELGPEQGVVIRCKPDFVLWPEFAPQKPIAVFVDGWKPHRERIGDDIAKRMAIARSGKFDVWSLTYDEIATALDPKAGQTETAWPAFLAGTASEAGVDALYKKFAIGHLKKLHAQSAFSQLRHLLAGVADDAQRVRLAVALSIRAGVVPNLPWDPAAFDELMSSPAGTALLASPAFVPRSGADLGRVWGATPAQLHLAIQMRKQDLQGVADRIDDSTLQPLLVLRWGSAESVDEADSKRLWQQLWHAANLLLPAVNTWIVADEGCSLAALAGASAYMPRSLGGLDWVAACELAHPSVARVLSQFAELGVAAPTVGYEMLDATGRVVGEAELAWESRRTAVVMNAEAMALFAKQGWTVFHTAQDGFEDQLRRALSDAASLTGKP